MDLQDYAHDTLTDEQREKLLSYAVRTAIKELINEGVLLGQEEKQWIRTQIDKERQRSKVIQMIIGAVVASAIGAFLANFGSYIIAAIKAAMPGK